MQIQSWQIPDIRSQKLCKSLPVVPVQQFLFLRSFLLFKTPQLQIFPITLRTSESESEAWILQFIILLPTVGLFLSNISKDICPHPPQWSLHRCNNGGSYDIWVRACQKLSSVKYFVQAAYFCENSLKLEILLNKRSIDHPQLCVILQLLYEDGFQFYGNKACSFPTKPYADFFHCFFLFKHLGALINDLIW